jgi:hypothetical protein
MKNVISVLIIFVFVLASASVTRADGLTLPEKDFVVKEQVVKKNEDKVKQDTRKKAIYSTIQDDDRYRAINGSVVQPNVPEGNIKTVIKVSK